MPGKIFINETADKQKVELTTGADGVTGGYYDPEGVWHDFGGGGGGGITNPTLTVNYVFGEGVEFSPVQTTTFSVEDGVLFGNTVLIPMQRTLETLVLASEEDDDVLYYKDLPVFENYSQTSSNEVNCEFEFESDEDYAVVTVTDHTQNASLTITVTDASDPS